MNCDYCDGDRDDYVRLLPKFSKGFNAFVSKHNVDKPQLVVTAPYMEGIFLIHYCPMCGKKLIK